MILVETAYFSVTNKLISRLLYFLCPQVCTFFGMARKIGISVVPKQYLSHDDLSHLANYSEKLLLDLPCF